jgi:hypothetical protein
MKAKRISLLLLGLIFLFAGTPLGIISLVAASEGLSGNASAFWIPLILSVVLLFSALLCFRARRKLLFKHFSKLYSDVDRVVIAHADSKFSALSVPFGSFFATRGRIESTLNMIIHFSGGSVSTRRVKPNSIEYRCLAPYIQG